MHIPQPTFTRPHNISRVTIGIAGFTAGELLVCLLVASIVVTVALPSMVRIVAEQRVVSATDNLLGLMRLARAEAMTGGPVLLCDLNHSCARFETTQHMMLARANSTPPHTEPEPGIDPLATLTLPSNVRVSWRRFRGDALLFHHSGTLHFQNGHFLVCNQHASRRIVMNWAGRPRVENRGRADPCPR